MAKQSESASVDVEQSLTRLEQYFEENRRNITIVAGAIFVLVAGYFAYTRLYLAPLEAEAQTEIYHAQELFQKDSLQAALNGKDGHLGFLDIAADYSATKAGNLANYYAGISYLKLGEFENAIRLLDDFRTQDPLLSVLALTAIGDAFLELEQPEEALEYYEKASKASDNDFAVPYALQKAALTAELLGDYEAALKHYRRIERDFADSQQGADIAKYIARAEAAQGAS